MLLCGMIITNGAVTKMTSSWLKHKNKSGLFSCNHVYNASLLVLLPHSQLHIHSGHPGYLPGAAGTSRAAVEVRGEHERLEAVLQSDVCSRWTRICHLLMAEVSWFWFKCMKTQDCLDMWCNEPISLTELVIAADPLAVAYCACSIFYILYFPSLWISLHVD